MMDVAVPKHLLGNNVEDLVIDQFVIFIMCQYLHIKSPY